MAPPFPTCAPGKWEDVKRKHYGVSGYHTITHLTASPPAQEPRLGCSPREKGGGWGGTNQKPENRELPTPRCRLTHSLPHRTPQGRGRPDPPAPSFPQPSASPHQSFKVKAQSNQQRWLPWGRPPLPPPTGMERSGSRLSGQRDLLDWPRASVGALTLQPSGRFRVRAAECWDCLSGQRHYWDVPMATARKANTHLLDWAVSSLLRTRTALGKGRGAYGLAPRQPRRRPCRGHLAPRRMPGPRGRGEAPGKCRGRGGCRDPGGV